MGIKDLLRFMKPYTEPIHIQKYSGKRVGIDAYSWLHKGAYSCSMELYLNSEGDKKYQYINYFMHRINLLRHHKIIPVVVFDGGNLPCKAATEAERYRKRKANTEMAMEKLREGNVNAASELFQRAISITPAMAHQLIQKLRSENVEFVVAPYEADAQLAYLSGLAEKDGGIVAVISEDSDLLAYGCPSVIFKMDKFGNGEEIAVEKVFNSPNDKPSFRNFNRDLFIEMCVLAGCDFLSSIPGIGIAKAHSLVSKYRNIDRVLSVLKSKRSKQVPEDYARSFKEAVAVFKHAKIYNKDKKQLDHLNELPGQLLEALEGQIDFLGPDIPSSIATAIAEGKLDPITMEAYGFSLSQRSRQHSAARKTSEQPEVSALAIAYTPETVSAVTAKSKDQMLKSKGYSCKVTELAESLPAFEAPGENESQSESCFTVFRTRNINGTYISARSTDNAQKRVLSERNFSDEVAALEKLASPMEVHKTANANVSDELVLNTPDNNPFKKRKCYPENCEITSTPKSGVTECSQLISNKFTFDSQDSVKLYSNKADEEIAKGYTTKKSKISQCKSSKSTTSILNFFFRI